MRKFKYILITLLAFTGITVNAQSYLKGNVIESGTNNRLSDVFIKNVTTKQIAIADTKGNFQIRAAAGNLLIFSSPGYVSDTLYLVDMRPKSIKMVSQSIALREVNIRTSRFNPREDYPEVYHHSKVYALSPTTWFGKEAKDARRLKHYFERESQERHVDSVFTRAYVSSIVPLRGQELEDFMTLYRPSYAYVHDNNGPSMAVYINDAYKKYLALPADKRKVQRLNGM
jgi:hypothetical protein